MPGTFSPPPLVSDSGMHHGTCVTHVPWCMSGSLSRGGGENVPGNPGACATLNFACLARGPCVTKEKELGHMTPRDNGKQYTCNHSVPLEALVQIKRFTLTTFVYLSLIFVRHNRLEIDTSMSVIVASTTTCEAHHSPRLRPWWVSQFVGEATKTTVLVSIPISVPELKLTHASKRGHWWHCPDSKVHWAIMGPIWGRQDPGGPYVAPRNFAFWVVSASSNGLAPVQGQMSTQWTNGYL